MKDIPLNVKVNCLDGNCGRSSHVIIDPSNQSVTYLVVQNNNFLDSSMRLVTWDKIVATTHKSIQLNCTLRELAAMEKFTKIHYLDRDSAEYSAFSLPATEIFDELDPYFMMPDVYADSICAIPVVEECIPAGEIAVRCKADVEAIDGHVGRLDELVIDPHDGHITGLVVRKGHFWQRKELTLPVKAIAQIDEYVVRLNLDRKTVESLPAVPIKSFKPQQATAI